jgi:hypothetical protein
MDQVREVFRLNIRYNHYAYRTEQTYCQWILRYIYYFDGKTHPNLLGAPDVEKFLSHLATEGKVSPSTQWPGGLVGWGRTKGSCLGLVADQANLLNIMTEYSINSCYLRLNCHFDILRLKKGTASFRFLFQHKSVCIIGIFPFSQCNRSPGKAICPHKF